MIADFTLGSHKRKFKVSMGSPPRLVNFWCSSLVVLSSKQKIQNLWWTKTNQQMLDDACRNFQMRPEASVFKSGNAPDCFSAFSEVFTRVVLRKPC